MAKYWLGFWELNLLPSREREREGERFVGIVVDDLESECEDNWPWFELIITSLGNRPISQDSSRDLETCRFSGTARRSLDVPSLSENFQGVEANIARRWWRLVSKSNGAPFCALDGNWRDCWQPGNYWVTVGQQTGNYWAHKDNNWATFVGQQRVKIGQQTWNCCAHKGNYWDAVGHRKAILDYLGTIGQILSTKGPISGQLLGHYCGSGTNRQVIFKIWAMLVFFNDCFRKTPTCNHHHHHNLPLVEWMMTVMPRRPLCNQTPNIISRTGIPSSDRY